MFSLKPCNHVGAHFHSRLPTTIGTTWKGIHWACCSLTQAYHRRSTHATTLICLPSVRRWRCPRQTVGSDDAWPLVWLVAFACCRWMRRRELSISPLRPLVVSPLEVEGFFLICPVPPSPTPLPPPPLPMLRPNRIIKMDVPVSVFALDSGHTPPVRRSPLRKFVWLFVLASSEIVYVWVDTFPWQLIKSWKVKDHLKMVFCCFNVLVVLLNMKSYEWWSVSFTSISQNWSSAAQLYW